MPVWQKFILKVLAAFFISLICGNLHITGWCGQTNMSTSDMSWYAEPDYVIHIDAHFNDLWELNTMGQKGGTADADIDTPDAWDITTWGSDVTVHPHLNHPYQGGGIQGNNESSPPLVGGVRGGGELLRFKRVSLVVFKQGIDANGKHGQLFFAKAKSKMFNKLI